MGSTLRCCTVLLVAFLAVTPAPSQATSWGSPRKLLASVLGDGFLGSRPKTLRGVLDWVDTKLSPSYIGSTIDALIQRYQDAEARIAKTTLTLNLVSETLPAAIPALDEFIKTKTGGVVADYMFDNKIINLRTLAAATDYSGVKAAQIEDEFDFFGLIGAGLTAIFENVESGSDAALTYGQAMLDVSAAVSKAADDMAAKYDNLKAVQLVLTKEDITDIKMVANEISQVLSSAGSAWFESRVDAAASTMEKIATRAEAGALDVEQLLYDLAEMAASIVSEASGTCNAIAKQLGADMGMRRMLATVNGTIYGNNTVSYGNDTYSGSYTGGNNTYNPYEDCPGGHPAWDKSGCVPNIPYPSSDAYPTGNSRYWTFSFKKAEGYFSSNELNESYTGRLQLAVFQVIQKSLDNLVPGAWAFTWGSPNTQGGALELTMQVKFPSGTESSKIDAAFSTVASSFNSNTFAEFQISSDSITEQSDYYYPSYGGYYNSDPDWADIVDWSLSDYLDAATWVFGKALGAAVSVIGDAIEQKNTRDEAAKVGNCGINIWRRMTNSNAAKTLAQEVNIVNYLDFNPDAPPAAVLKGWLLVGTEGGIVAKPPTVNLTPQQALMQQILTMPSGKAKDLSTLASEASKKFQTAFMTSIKKAFSDEKIIIEIKKIETKLKSVAGSTNTNTAATSNGRRSLLQTADTTVTIISTVTVPTGSNPTDVVKGALTMLSTDPTILGAGSEFATQFDVASAFSADVTSQAANLGVIPGVTESNTRNDDPSGKTTGNGGGADDDDGGSGMSDKTKLAIGLGVGIGGGVLVLAILVIVIVVVKKKGSVAPS